MTETIKNLLGLQIIFISLTLQGQSMQTVRDSLTNEHISYVNIWVENEMVGTTTNEKGEFSFSNKPIGKWIVFSAIGYKSKRVIYIDGNATTLLQPQVTELKEVIVRAERKFKRIEIGEFKKSKIRHYFGCSGHPYMVGKYFSFDEKLFNAPYLGQIEIHTASDIENAKINIRLYTMNESGVPEKAVYNENIIATVKKGNSLTTVDFSAMQIEMPKTGILIAVEFLIIESNKFMYQYTVQNKKEKLEITSYEPAIGTIPKESGENSWQYNMGKWRRTGRMTNIKALPKYNDKFTEIAVKLTLID